MKKDDKLKVKIFVGVELNSELQMKLSKSLLWKEATFNPDALKKTHFQGKDYIGRFFAYGEVTVKDLKNMEKNILDTLVTYSPEIKIDKLETLTFPQVFVA